MDVSNFRRVPLSSISYNRRSQNETSVVIQSRRAEFFETYQLQDFSLPDSIMFYLAKNPQSPELYEKIIQTCKDFFVKNPILIIPEFFYRDGKWKLYSDTHPVDSLKTASKFWITNTIYVIPANKKAVDKSILSPVISKLYQCDAKSVSIDNQSFSIRDLSLLISSAESIFFTNLTVKDENGTNTAFENIVKIAVNAKKLEFWSGTTLSNITSNTMKELIKLPQFLKLDLFSLNRIPEAFDLEAFYGYMKKNKTTKIYLSFDDSVSKAYENRLDEIVDEILAIETHGYKPPFIGSYSLLFEKMDKLSKLQRSH